MKHLFIILFLAAVMSYIVYSCSSVDDIQVERRYVILVKKEQHQLGDEMIIWQYWQDDKYKDVVYSERLQAGDTGFFIGMKAPVFARR